MEYNNMESETNKKMYALVCVNEESEVVSVSVSESIETLRELMKKEYDAERDDAFRSGYEEYDLEELSYIDEDSASVAVEDSWSYEWTIVECNKF